MDYPVVKALKVENSAYFERKAIAQDSIARRQQFEKRSKHHLYVGNQIMSSGQFADQVKVEHFNPCQSRSFKIEDAENATLIRKKKHYYAYFANHCIQNFENKQRLVIAFPKKELPASAFCDHQSLELVSRMAQPVFGAPEVFVETAIIKRAKPRASDKYEVRNFDELQSYIAFVVVTYRTERHNGSYDDYPFVQYSTSAPNGDGRHDKVFDQKADEAEGLVAFWITEPRICKCKVVPLHPEQTLEPLIKWGI
ncbi:MAG: hypothetical protein H6573_16405 [Lewinellaceae bacterium]|nr:hypothetical protein [Lewinellaceae bacterium]